MQTRIGMDIFLPAGGCSTGCGHVLSDVYILTESYKDGSRGIRLKKDERVIYDKILDGRHTGTKGLSVQK